jgi:hypothetical protein
MAHLREIVQRLAGILRLQGCLDSLYERVVVDAFSAEQLGAG